MRRPLFVGLIGLSLAACGGDGGSSSTDGGAGRTADAAPLAGQGGATAGSSGDAAAGGSLGADAGTAGSGGNASSDGGAADGGNHMKADGGGNDGPPGQAMAGITATIDGVVHNWKKAQVESSGTGYRFFDPTPSFPIISLSTAGTKEGTYGCRMNNFKGVLTYSDFVDNNVVMYSGTGDMGADCTITFTHEAKAKGEHWTATFSGTLKAAANAQTTKKTIEVTDGVVDIVM